MREIPESIVENGEGGLAPGLSDQAGDIGIRAALVGPKRLGDQIGIDRQKDDVGWLLGKVLELGNAGWRNEPEFPGSHLAPVP